MKPITAWAVVCGQEDYVEGVEMTREDALKRADHNLICHKVIKVLISFPKQPSAAKRLKK